MLIFLRHLFTIYCLVLLLMHTSCEDMFKKTIDIDVADMPAKLSITASLDVDSGRFSIYVFASQPVSEFKDWRPIYESIISNGEIRLYEGETNILTIHGQFDLSTRITGSGADPGYNGYRFHTVGLPLKAGGIYRLEVDIEGYPTATAVGVMPSLPVCNAVVDTVRRMYYGNIFIPSGYHGSLGFSPDRDDNYSYLLDLSIMYDNDEMNNYYYLQLRTYLQHECNQENFKIPLNSYNDYLYPIGVSDLSLILNQPEYWNEVYELGDNAYDLYLVDYLALTNQTFSGSNIHLPLYLPARTYRFWGLNAPLPDYSLEEYGPEVRTNYRHDLLVRHISEDTYKHIRNMALQSKGIDFFTEPVTISGNIQNGYGYFSLSNTKRFNLLNFEKYTYW